jgi:hypothetical protein
MGEFISKYKHTCAGHCHCGVDSKMIELKENYGDFEPSNNHPHDGVNSTRISPVEDN